MIVNSNFKAYSSSSILDKNRIPQNPHNNVNFNGSLGKTFLAALAVSITVIAHDVYDSTIGALKDYANINNEKEISKEVGWTPNIRVLASTGQNRPGAITNKDSYSTFLCNLLKNNKIETIEQANDSLAKNGYKINFCTPADTVNLPKVIQKMAICCSDKLLYPLETPGEKLKIFNKKDKEKNRFILCLTDTTKKAAEKNNDDFIKNIKNIYDIDSSNIVKIKSFQDKTTANLEKGIDSIVNKIKKLKNIQNAEVLILYSGHGNTQGLFNWSLTKFEGALNGRLSGEIKEQDVKKILNKNLKGIKTLLIMDTCKSGAWIAKGKEQAQKTIKGLA